jgi:ABC-type branched-subunit amino acid transport system ATPase component
VTGAAASLELEAVTAGYGPIMVLDGLSLRAARHEIVAVLGANGSGKSTALRTVAGLTRMTAGRIVLDGTDLTPLPAHRRAALGVGYVPQMQNVFGDLTVSDNLRMGAWLHPASWRDDAEQVFTLFPALAGRRRQLARELSGGERRMLAIGLTLLLRPRVLLLDEPSSDLAPAMVDAVFAALGRIHADRGLPTLLVEQNVVQALAVAHRVCVLVRGRGALDVPAARADLAELHRLFVAGTGPAGSQPP